MITDNTTKWRVRKLTKTPYEIEGSLLPLGHIYFSFEPTVPAGRIPAFGGLYDRTLYADLWLYANAQGLVISETEWQKQATANGGNCSFYSDGNGSTTFRVPALKCWVKGASGIEEVGNYLQAGLPNIDGEFGRVTGTNGTDEGTFTGAFSYTGSLSLSNGGVGNATNARQVNFNASKSNSIYGNSDTVQPPSIVGTWLIVAYGTVSNVGNADVANVMQAVEQVQTSVGALEQGVGTAIDYIVESYRNGTEWYEVYKSGKVRQGGITTTIAEDVAVYITLLKKMGNTNYSVFMTQFGDTLSQYTNGVTVITKATNRFQIHHANYDTKYFWVAEGQGA